MENKTNSMNISVKSIIDIIFRNRIVIFITFVFCFIITLIIIEFVTPIYDANVKMLVRGRSVVTSDIYESINPRGIHATQAEIVKSEPVLKRSVIALNLHKRGFDYEKNYCSNLKKRYIELQTKKIEKKLNDLSPEKIEDFKLNRALEDLRSRLTVSVLPGTDIFIINVTAFTAEEAIETANVVSRSYTMFDQIQQLAEITMKYGEFHPTVIQLKDNINYATQNLSGKPLPDIEAIGTASVKIIEQASSTNMAVSKPKIVILAIALFISICFSFGIGIVKGLFDRTIKSPADIIGHLNIPCIGSIPKKKLKDKYLITDYSPETSYYNFYAELSEQLFVFLKTQGLKTAAITATAKNKNYKYIVPNIGYFLSRIMGKKILLIEANFNIPQFHKIYSIKNEKVNNENILLNMSADSIHKQDNGPEIIPAPRSLDKFYVILNNLNFKTFIENHKDEYDAILIDATSLISMKDISFISKYCDGTVLTIDEGKLQRDMLRNTIHRFKNNNVSIIGGILNNRTFPIPDFIYKYFKYFID